MSSGKNFLRKNKLTGEVKMHFNKTGMATSFTTINTAFATIPVGYRPSEDIIIFGIGYNGESYEQITILISSNVI